MSLQMVFLFDLFPNPSSSHLEFFSPAKAEAEVINSSGEIVQRFSCSQGSTKVSIENLPIGIYFLRLLTAEANSSATFIRIDNP